MIHGTQNFEQSKRKSSLDVVKFYKTRKRELRQKLSKTPDKEYQQRRDLIDAIRKCQVFIDEFGGLNE